LDIVKRLTQLENERSSMIPSREQRENWDILIEKLVKDAISNKEEGPAFRLLPDGEKIIDEDFTLRSSPRDMETTLQQISDKIVSFGVQMGNPNNMSYIPGSESYLTALGDYLGAVINPYTGVAITNPGATAMQQSLLKWAGGFLGYTGDFGGDITSGGSIANLTAIITARDAFQIQPEDIRQSTVYYSAHAHHSVTKALHLAGMQYCQQRSISCYDDFAINLEELEKTIAEDKEAGLKPWLLVGNAGTTDTGTVDDLNGMADIAEKYACWFHVDGAYGAAFALCVQGKKQLAGIERTDSVVLDPHKILFLSFGCGLVLVKNGSALTRAHQFAGNYMRDKGVDESHSPASNSAELTRPFRALRMWLPLTVLGTEPYRAALEEKMLLAQYAHEKLGEIDNVWVGPLPQLSIVVFRYDSGDAAYDDKINQQLIDDILAEGRFYLSTTTLNNMVALRLAILSTRTNRKAVDNIIDMLKNKIGQIEV
jgi:aromatic-L-amino-acid/L-tryptophan decarboxylase